MSTLACVSHIARVIVYARGATVTRRIELPESLPSEPCELVLSGLSPQAEAGSLRAELVGEREVVALQTRLVVPETGEDPGELIAQREELQHRLERLHAELSALVRRRERLGATEPRLRVKRSEPDPAARARDALAATGLALELLGELDARSREQGAALELLERERSALELRIAQARAGETQRADRAAREVVIRLGAGPGRAEAMELSYGVQAARWWPAYAARLSEGGVKSEWSLEAFVAQASGEDWSEVQLALSTADLVADARLPELRSLRLGRSQPAPTRGFRPPPEGLDALFGGYDDAKRVGASTRPAPARGAKTATGAYPRDHAREFDEVLADLGDDSELAFGSGLEMAASDEPPPPPAPRPERRKKGAPGGAALQMVEAAASVPVAAARMAFKAAAPSASLTKAGSIRGGHALTADGCVGEPAPEPEPLGIEPADAWLDFDALELAPTGDAARRGRLRRSHEPSAAAILRAARGRIDRLASPRFAQDPLQDRGRFDHRYDAAGLVDVPANAQPHRVTLGTAEAGGRSRLRAVPREDEAVFREVELDNPFDAPLLGGPTDVFFDGALLTTSRIAPVGRGGAIVLGLGVEDRVRVARNVSVEESTHGLLGGTTEVLHTVTLEVASSLGAATPLVVVDRFPVTDDDDVSVELVSSTPRAMRYKQLDRDASGAHLLRGGLRWDLTLEPGAKHTLSFRYEVTLPSKRVLQGGNRRD